ncbi:hypothetical protein AB205_0104850 [Aquarana catesbeiana]|uniref:Uncharacterized protein n=1 Tax=Aquarana catesbeiana TaxID=8400 RepID=A0A2G9R8J5_AQUCT|nr:hypothetical protein AB205_0104850 [Aquarana catesbeiana]
MVETKQVHAEESSNEKSPGPRTSRSQRRLKASNMSFVEMVEMVDILKKADYDGKHGPYPNPNVRKAKIMTKDVKSLQKNFAVMWMLWKKNHFTSESAQILIGEIMGCNHDLENIKENINDVQKNI